MVTRLDVRSLCVGVPTPSGWARPVNDVSLTLAKGELLDIVGESGSGKTSLALALLGLEPPSAPASAKPGLSAAMTRTIDAA